VARQVLKVDRKTLVVRRLNMVMPAIPPVSSSWGELAFIITVGPPTHHIACATNHIACTSKEIAENGKFFDSNKTYVGWP
jgi:hypothetical protein